MTTVPDVVLHFTNGGIDNNHPGIYDGKLIDIVWVGPETIGKESSMNAEPINPLNHDEKIRRQWYERQEQLIYWFLIAWTFLYITIEVAVFTGDGARGMQWKMSPGIDKAYLSLLTLYVGIKEVRRYQYHGKRQSHRSGELFFYLWWTLLIIMHGVVTFAGKPFEVPSDLTDVCIGVLILYAISLGVKGYVEITFVTDQKKNTP